MISLPTLEEVNEIKAMEMLLGARWIPPTGGTIRFPGYFLKKVKGEAGGLPVHWDVYYDRQGQEIDTPVPFARKYG